MTNLIVIAVVALVVGAAGAYVYKSKKKGTKCIGCPSAQSCANCSRGCGGKH